MADDKGSASKPRKLNLACSSTDCKNGLHYFGPLYRKKDKSPFSVGSCKDCGAALVDWTRVHQRKTGDTAYTLEMLKSEHIRHHFWYHHVFSQRELNYAGSKGLSGLRSRAEQLLQKNICIENSPWEGRQTPMAGKKLNVIHCAQHATATCCRKCIEYWHGIPRDKPVADGQVTYMTDLIMRYIKDRLPNLSEEGK